MNLKAYSVQHEAQAKEIHEKFFGEQFGFPDFYSRLGFSILDDNDKVICVAAVRPIAELVVITDKDETTRRRYEALLRVLDFSKYLTAQRGLNELHAFVQDEPWLAQVKRYGFKDCIGKAVVLGV